MDAKRKAAEEAVLNAMKILDKSGKNVRQYEKMFAGMSDKDFYDYVSNIEKGEDVLAFYSSNMTDKLKLEDLMQIAKDMGVELFERIRIYDVATETYYLTPYKCCVLEVPTRPMSQFVMHKLSVPEGDSHIDVLSGQVVQDDKAASISQVETQTMHARGLKFTIMELLKSRGGDVVAFSKYKRELEEGGHTSVTPDGTSVPRSAVTVDALLAGMQIKSNASGV